MFLDNSQQDQVHSEMEFQINKCYDDLTENEEIAQCAKPEEIDAFISRVKVEIWTIFYEPDLKNHDGLMPLKKIQKKIGEKLL